MTYSEKLKDPRWQRRRLEIMERDQFACLHCGDTKSTLNVHHAFYENGKAPWEYDDDCLFTLCETCHKKAEKLRNSFSTIYCSGDWETRWALEGVLEEINSEDTPDLKFAIRRICDIKDCEDAVHFVFKSINKFFEKGKGVPKTCPECKHEFSEERK